MRTVMGEGCWPGKAQGVIVWWSPMASGLAADRAVEIMALRDGVARAAADLETWCDHQETLALRLLFQGYTEVLLEDAWSRRACALIDTEGLAAGTAAVTAAGQVAAIMARSDDLRERAGRLESAARWLAGRLARAAGPELPPDAVIAAADLSPLELLDLRCPALIAGPEPPVRGDGTLVWGVPGLGPDWHGRRVSIDGPAVTLDPPEARGSLPDSRRPPTDSRWLLDGDRLNGLPLCVLNGHLEVIRHAAHKAGRPPAVLVRRLDDLAALPLYVGDVAAIALDLDGLGPAPRLKHPGFGVLLNAALQAAKAKGIPMLAGGEPAFRQPELWLSLGFTALFERSFAHRVVRPGRRA